MFKKRSPRGKVSMHLIGPWSEKTWIETTEKVKAIWPKRTTGALTALRSADARGKNPNHEKIFVPTKITSQTSRRAGNTNPTDARVRPKAVLRERRTRSPTTKKGGRPNWLPPTREILPMPNLQKEDMGVTSNEDNQPDRKGKPHLEANPHPLLETANTPHDAA